MLPYFPPVQSCVYQITAPVAPPADEIRLAPNEAADFTKGLAAIAKIIKGTIVVEGVPLKGRRAEPGTAELSGSTSEVLRRFAESYDYGVIRLSELAADKGDVFLFAKRYTTGKEIPCVTEGEYRAALSDLRTALETFAADPPLDNREKRIRQSVKSLSEEERKRCLQGGIPASQLSEGTHRFLWQVVSDIWLGTSIQGVSGAQTSLIQFESTGNIAKANQKGFEYLSVTFMTPSGTVQTTEDGSVIKTVTGQTLFTTTLFPTVLPSEPGATLPPPKTELLGQTEATAQAGGEKVPATDGVTLESLLQTLNHRNPARRYEALPYIGGKIVSVAGVDNATPDAIIMAVSRLYGLRLQKTKTGEKDVWRLQRPSFSALRSPVELPSAVFKILPLPLLRATGLLNDLFVPSASGSAASVSPTLADKRSEAAQHVDPMRRMDQVRQECRREATAGIEQILLRQRKPTVRYRDLPESLRSAVSGYEVMSQVATLFQEFIGRGQGLPPAYITHFEESILTLNTDKEGGAITGFTLSAAHLPQRIGQGSILSITLPE